MRLLIVGSSQRAVSQSAKVAVFIKGRANHYSVVNYVELHQLELPLWDGEEQTKSQSLSWKKVGRDLTESDAVVVVTPEWGGMASPLLKNFLLMCEARQTAHKPLMIVSVSSGIGGANPVAELRMNSLKNNKFVAVPDHLIIRNVTEVLNKTCDFKLLSKRDRELRERIDFSLARLFQYALALKDMRKKLAESPYPNQNQYAFGM
jgi:NAD(P)H-dependent FMN reductase